MTQIVIERRGCPGIVHLLRGIEAGNEIALLHLGSVGNKSRERELANIATQLRNTDP